MAAGENEFVLCILRRETARRIILMKKKRAIRRKTADAATPNGSLVVEYFTKEKRPTSPTSSCVTPDEPSITFMTLEYNDF